MLIPQFSIRQMLAVMTGGAVVFSVMGFGVRGHRWAGALSVGLAALVVLMAVYAAVFGLVWMCTVFLARTGRLTSGPGQSPFDVGPSLPRVRVEPQTADPDPIVAELVEDEPKDP